MSLTAAQPPALRIAFGSTDAALISPGLPILAGEPVDTLFAAARRISQLGRIALFELDGWHLGAATVPLVGGLEAETVQLYREIFQAVGKRHLARIWNFVPAINEAGPDGLENYRVFCRGRSVAFEERHGAAFKSLLPSASAVGCQPGALTVIFAASALAPRHVENPLQMPAYEYPPAYGPRSPSFARATLVTEAHRTTVFISGTAAIRGHATMARHSTRDQLDWTLENLTAISTACGCGPDLRIDGKHARHFKVYLRHATDQPAVAAVLEARLLRRGDAISYVRADVCRTELNIEIEATLWPV
jgi:chorismate lyase / 3-hydroxybenzoate synthase